MKSTRAAGRYSKALLELAIERNELEQIKDDALVVLNAIHNSRELRNLLASPVVKPLQKQAILVQIFEKNTSLLTTQFITLLVKQGRGGILEEVYLAFMSQYRDSKNILEATFITSTQVPAATIAALKSMLEKATSKNVEVKQTVDANLIGGYIVDMQNYRLDASLAGGMKKLKKELSK